MAGIYIHIPFCKQQCSYCDFHFSTTFSAYREQLIKAIIKEIEERRDYLNQAPIQTIYFGGGTPSLLKREEIKSLFESVKKNYNLSSEIEFTLEANPDDINEEILADWKDLGINRLSIGVQSFYQDDLNWMNRAHTAEEGTNAVEKAKQMGFLLTVDLIYGLPHHSISHLKHNIEQLVHLGTEHISAYCLTVEKGTVLNHMMKKGDLPVVSEEEQAEQFEVLVQQLKKAGYQQYEISNFAKKKAYSKHNSNYWRGISYLGVGPSAHSFNGKSRQWNVANNRKYIKGISEGEALYEKEILHSIDQFNELLLTGLRTKWGVHLKELITKHSPTSDFYSTLNSFESNQLLKNHNNTLYLTEKGKLQADYIASMLFLDKP